MQVGCISIKYHAFWEWFSAHLQENYVVSEAKKDLEGDLYKNKVLTRILWGFYTYSFVP